MEQSQYSSPYVLSYKYRLQRRHKPTTVGLVKDSVKTVSKEYCAESSICGLKHLVDENTSCCERALWVITMISALVCSVSLVWMTFVRFYRAPLVTTQMPEGVSVNSIIFPAVGICTNNRISKRAVVQLARSLLKEKRNKQYKEEEMLTMLSGLGLLYNLQTMNDLVVQPMKLHKALGEYNVNELLRDLTPRCEDLLVRCAWNEVPMNCSKLFDFRLTMNGYCCTFNYLRKSDVMFEDKQDNARTLDMYKYGNKSNFDFDQGLKVLMRLNESDDFYYNMPMQGAQLQFSDAYDFPDAPSGSFSMQIISPNVQMTVTVTASFTEASRDIQHVPVKLRGCLFYDESTYLPFYTHSDCLLKCRMLFLLSKCQCTPFNMPKMANTRTCDMRDITCLRMFNAQSTTVRPEVDHIPPELELEMVGGGIPCPMCYPSCSKTAYSYDFTNVKIYPDHLNEVPDIDRIDWLQGANFTGTSLVHVKYAREVADCYGQNVIMKWFDLISNIGSTCGFVTGFSFVSVLEFIYFYTVKLVREIRNRRKQARRIETDSSYSANLDFISRCRPIYWNEISGSTHVFWAIFVILSWYGAILLILAQYDAYHNNPISFVVETTYKDWDTNFPAIAVCEQDNAGRIEEVSDGLWGVDHDFNIEEVLKELAYFRGLSYYVTQYCTSNDSLAECTKIHTNLTYYANLLRLPCSDFIHNCTWMGKQFDCCKYFRPLETELGVCFVINSIQGSEKDSPKLEMINNKKTGPGAIQFDVMVAAKIFILNEEEVPTFTTIGSDVIEVAPELSYRRYISIKNIENDAGARLIPPKKRKCRYTDENILQVYPYYSYTACTVQCRKDAQVRMCNCASYFMPNVPEEEKCNMSGMECLSKNYPMFSSLKASWSPRVGLYCDCLPSCTEAEISTVKDFQEPLYLNYSRVHIELSTLPSERFRRNVVRGVLDLVVSTGGTGGLFLGASLLSFVEFFYILLLRPLFDIYSQRNDDPWHRKYGTRRLEDNKLLAAIQQQKMK
ncbi:uncharacterized protein LOC121733272 [Aricia agestis]|uniref:uncharacterized protein LOC121733272 n=1 Tax=Aricia agestis TaxID=91739 RepID=UPI001C205816|nr:uncharacterized protein LOC121733272 [Aricia agestis]